MRKLMVIALTIVLALGLSVGVASAFGPSLDWEVTLEGFANGNFTAGGSILGATPGYLEGVNTEGYYMETGALVTKGIVELLGHGNEDWGVTKLVDYWYCNPCWYGGTDAKTIDVYQKLQQSQNVTGDSLVTTFMYSSYRATDYPDFVKMEQVVNSMFYDYTYQWIVAYGMGPGSASMYTIQDGAVYGLLGAEVAGGSFNFNGWQIVNYTDDTADVSGSVDIWGSW